ncbi:MAG: hypothetical protein AVDCRST_MAG12-3201, partial [uncultured Rubrobacteraceae bacterium]
EQPKRDDADLPAVDAPPGGLPDRGSRLHPGARGRRLRPAHAGRRRPRRHPHRGGDVAAGPHQAPVPPPSPGPQRGDRARAEGGDACEHEQHL